MTIRGGVVYRVLAKSKINLGDEHMDKTISLITLDYEIRIIGLSFAKSGLPGTVESLSKMWDMYGERYRNKVKHATAPLIDYGVNCALTTSKHEYIAGCSVTEIGELDANWAPFIVPPGMYIKHSRCKMDDLFKYENDVKVWAETNGYKINEDFMIEVYPSGAFEGKDVEVYALTPVVS